MTKRQSAIGLGILGVIFLICYFLLFARSEVAEWIDFQVPGDEIIERATKAYHDSPMAAHDLHRRVRLNINESLFRHVQTRRGLQPESLAVHLADWEIIWMSPIEVDNKQEIARFALKYGLNGELIGFEKYMPSKEQAPDLAEVDAIRYAREYLTAHKVDTASIQISSMNKSDQDQTQVYEFVFEKPSNELDRLDEKYVIELVGEEVVKFERRFELDEEGGKIPQFESVGDTVGGVLAGIMWFIVIVAIVAILIKRLRSGELEFKAGAWAGGMVLLVVGVRIAFAAWPQWRESLIAGTLGGVFSGIAVLLSYAATESLARKVWPEKLHVTDLIMRGVVRAQEIGVAILLALWVAGATLLSFGAAVWLSGKLGIGFVMFEDDAPVLIGNLPGFIFHALESVTFASFIGIIFLLFWTTFLRTKINNRLLLTAGTAATFLIAILQYQQLRPSVWAVLLLIPTACLWAYFILRYNFFTIILALFCFSLLHDTSIYSLLKNPLSDYSNIFAGELMLVMFIAGLVISFSKASIKDFGEYVPAYVRQIAERERQLQELEIARRVQMSFLPEQVPHFPHLDIASICRPAMEVGGDYYDFIKLDGARMSVVIGDVSGKGVSAAFFMTLTKGILKTLADRVKSPKQLLVELNEIFYENTPKEVFISAIYGVFDFANRKFSFARAGHNPLMLCGDDRHAPEYLYPQGIAIGLENGQLFAAKIEEMTIEFKPGDLFVFYTDGISEAMDQRGDEFGEERLKETIAEHRGETASELLSRVTTAIESFSQGALQHDDYTMIVIKVTS